jgi:DNA-directed RNA polymerase alpha subunit
MKQVTMLSREDVKKIAREGMKQVTILSREDVKKIAREVLRYQLRLEFVALRKVMRKQTRLMLKGESSAPDDMDINDLELGVRAANCLNCANVTTVGQLAMKSDNELRKYRNVGPFTLQELHLAMIQVGRSIGETPKGVAETDQQKP